MLHQLSIIVIRLSLLRKQSFSIGVKLLAYSKHKAMVKALPVKTIGDVRKIIQL